MLYNRYSVEANPFNQFVFDNADFNVRSVGDYGTLNSMGGIMCVTPGSVITNTGVTDRIKCTVKVSLHTQLDIHDGE